MIFNSKLIKGALIAFVSLLATSQSAFAQSVVQMGTTELKTEAKALVDENKYLEARPFIVELIKRINDSQDEVLKKELEQLNYFLAFSYLQEYNNTPEKKHLNRAISGFDRVINEFPNGSYAESAIKTKASCYDLIGDVEKAIKAREMLLQKPYVNKLNYAEQYDIVKRICEAIYYPRKWKIGEVWFERMLNMARNPEDKVFAASGLIQCKIAKKEYDAIKKYFPYMVYDAPARSDIALNLALLTSGDELVKKEKFSDASVIYNMVLNRDEIEANLKRFLEVAKARHARAHRINPESQATADAEKQVKILEAQIEALAPVQDYTAELMARNARNYMLTERDFEGFWSYYRMLRTYPNHQNAEDFYMASIIGAQKIGKDDTMFQLGEEYLKNFSEGTYVKDIQLQRAQYFLKKKDTVSFFALAQKFIAENPDEPPYSNDFIFLMGKTWLDMGKYKELVTTFGKYNKENPDTAISEGCMYWSGIAYLATSDFKNAAKVLAKMIDSFPNGAYAEDGMYRSGVAAFGAGNFGLARDTLEDFVSRYPNSVLRGEVEFFLGDIYANNAHLEYAMKHYSAVEKYTKNQNFIDNAYTQSAKLLHDAEKYDEEIALMDKYIAKYPKGICSDASFNKAKAFELLAKPADALAIYGDAIMKYGANFKDDGVDKMILDYNRMYLENEKKLAATMEFLKALLKDKELLRNMVEVPAKRYRYFQDNPNIDKRLYEKFKRDKAFGPQLYKDKTLVNKLIATYAEQIAKYPKGGTAKVFNEMIAKAKSAKNKTLEYRLLMGLDAIGVPVKDQQMFTIDDIKIASMRTLVWMGKLNEKYGAEHARKPFEEAVKRDEFEYLIDALFGAAALEERLAAKGQGKWEVAIKFYQEIEKDFPSDPRAATAMLKRTDILMKLGKRNQAIKCYETVLKSPAWRGEAYAEALYKLGQIAMHNKKTNEALMYFDRCYLGYANCYNWTGKAVLSAAQLLVANGENKKAKELCAEFIENKLNEASPDYAEIKQYFNIL